MSSRGGSTGWSVPASMTEGDGGWRMSRPPAVIRPAAGEYPAVLRVDQDGVTHVEIEIDGSPGPEQGMGIDLGDHP